MKKFALFVFGAFVAVFSMSTWAVIDVTAVTTGISDAQVAIIAIITALLALSVAIFGLVKVYRFVSRRAGA